MASTASSAVKAAKKELRRAMKQKLGGVTAESLRTQSDAVFQALMTFEPYVRAQSVGVYLAMPHGEIQTAAIVQHALSAGKQVYVPYLHKTPPEPGRPTSVMNMVMLHSVADFAALERDKWDIPTVPAASVGGRQRVLDDAALLHELDLILMPGMAFGVDPHTHHFTRLGHGRGYYDYFLHRYATAQGAATDHPSGVSLYALALREQFLEETVPVESTDVPIDGMVLGTGEIRQ